MAGEYSMEQVNDRSITRGLLIFGVLAAVAIVGGGKLKKVLTFNKMVNDVVVLNNAVRAFKSSGGKFEPDVTLEMVIESLKSVDPNKISPELRSFSLDKRFSWKMQTVEQAAADGPRTFWNPRSMKFEIQLSGKPGAIDFHIGSTPTEISYDEPSRFEYVEDLASKWSSENKRTNHARFTPEVVRVNVEASLPVQSDPLPVSLSSFEGTDDHSRDLGSPVFSISEAGYSASGSDISVAISNPNPEDATSVIWSINYGPWQTYDGTPVSVEAGDTLLAIAKPIDPTSATNSPAASTTYKDLKGRQP